LNAMFGLDPANSFLVTRGTAKQVIGHALGKGEIRAVLGDTVPIEKEFRDPGRAAALAHVVPKTLRPLFRYAALQDGTGGALDPGKPLAIFRGLIQTVKQARRSDRAVTPAQIE